MDMTPSFDSPVEGGWNTTVVGGGGDRRANGIYRGSLFPMRFTKVASLWSYLVSFGEMRCEAITWTTKVPNHH